MLSQFWMTALVGAAALGQGPKPAPETLASLRVAPPFAVELVAAEPLVQDPVALTWDEHGRLFVAEMTDYPTETTGGRIRWLRDRDGDGTIDDAVVFADRLAFPTSALAYRGGLLVTAAPHILFLKDTDGDGTADERKVVFTGFGEGNQQLRVNGLAWGLDNWVYGANGRSNGAVRPGSNPAAPAISIDNHDFRFRPEGSAFAPVAGFSQFGQAFDDFGNRFISWNTIHVRHAVLTARQLQRNPLAALGSAAAHIADHGDAGRVYSLAPPQPRYNREPAGYFNASCGLTIERGGLFPSPFAGSAFVCEPLFNVVHRDELVPSGATFRATRGAGEQEAEFLASTDPWFRPVNLASGPDGALYIADFYREWVEHPQFVPDELEKGIAFRKGHDLGRIWRVRYTDRPLFPLVDLSRRTVAELVGELSHPNGWRRTTAQRLLLEQNDPSARPLLEDLAQSAAGVLGRVHALWTLEGLGQLSERQLLRAMEDESAEVRAQAVLLSERMAPLSPLLVGALLKAAGDPDPRVRFLIAGRLGELPIEQTVRPLAQIARRDAADPWTRAAILSSIGQAPTAFLEQLQKSLPAALSSEQMSLVEQAAAMVGLKNGPPEQKWLAAKVQAAGPAPPSDWLLAAVVGASSGAARRGQSLASLFVESNGASNARRHVWFGWAESQARAADVALHRRQYALRLLSLDPSEPATAALGEFLGPSAPPELQRAALAGLRRRRSPAAADLLLSAWPQASGSLRAEILGAVFADRARIALLLTAVEDGRIAAGALDLHWREQLQQIGDEGLRRRAQKLLTQVGGQNRLAVVQKFAPALGLTPNAARGRELFVQHCAACHRFRGHGADVGPDLSGIVVKSKEQILSDLFDPNREIVPNYAGFVVATKDGALRTGLLAAESSTAISLRQAEGLETPILRSEIESLRTSGRSLMPEGFEQNLGLQDVADLIGYLRQ